MFKWEKKKKSGGTERNWERLRKIEWEWEGEAGEEVERKNETESLREELRMILKDLTWFYSWWKHEDQEECR